MGSTGMGLLEGGGSTDLSHGKLPDFPGKCKHLGDVDRRQTCLSLKTSPLMQCPAGLEPTLGPVAMGVDGNAFALELCWLPRDGLRDRESEPDPGSDLPNPACGYWDPQPGVGRAPRGPCSPGCRCRELGLQWDPSLPRLHPPTAPEMRDGALHRSPWQGPVVPPACPTPLPALQFPGRDRGASESQMHLLAKVAGGRRSVT